MPPGCGGVRTRQWQQPRRSSPAEVVLTRAGACLPAVTAPTLLIVGGRDDVVLGLTREALTALRCVERLSVVPGATHLFEEPGTLRIAAELARDWFVSHLGSGLRQTAVGG